MTYSIRKLSVEVLSERDQCLDWCVHQGLLPNGKMCLFHQTPMNWNRNSSGLGDFRCCKKGHLPKKISISLGTWFENRRLSVEKCILMAYCFAMDFSYELAIRETSDDNSKTSSETVSDYYSYCKEVVVATQLQREAEEGKIGGVGVIVQIDDCQIGRSKYHKGRATEERWVLGMLESGDPTRFRCVVCPENRRDAAAIRNVILEHVERGTTIYTDCGAGFCELDSDGYYIHQTVNLAINFVDPESGVNIQKIESLWRPLKEAIIKGGCREKNFDIDLVVYCWRRYNKLTGLDMFTALLRVIRNAYPVRNI